MHFTPNKDYLATKLYQGEGRIQTHVKVVISQG